MLLSRAWLRGGDISLPAYPSPPLSPYSIPVPIPRPLSLPTRHSVREEVVYNPSPRHNTNTDRAIKEREIFNREAVYRIGWM